MCQLVNIRCTSLRQELYDRKSILFLCEERMELYEMAWYTVLLSAKSMRIGVQEELWRK